LLFAGNLIRQPYMKDRHYRIIGDVKMCDYVMHNTFWLGLYPGLSEQHFVYMADMFREFLKKYV
jgi:CDP-6-deoxy-D-xylo-4-hexulose-3-dehydrase